MTVIKVKNSNVAGRIPTSGNLQPAELAVNLKDRKLYSKDADGNVFELGNGAQVPSGDTPPTGGNDTGDLFWDTANEQLLYWDGSEWLPIAGKEAIGITDLTDVTIDGGLADGQVLAYDNSSSEWVNVSPASLAVDVDLGYTAAADGGTVTNTAGDNAELPLVDITNAGLMSPNDFGKLGDMPAFIAGPSAPDAPSSNDIWIDTGDCPPTINIWDDCADPGNPSWTPIGGGGSGGNRQVPVQIISSNGTELGATLTAIGGNGVDKDGDTVTATYAWTGAKTGAGTTIIADVEGSYTVTATVAFFDGSRQTDAASWTIIDTYVPPTNETPPVIAVVGEGPDGAYESNRTYVVTNATVINGASPTIAETQWFLDGVQNSTGSIFTIPDSSVGAVITAK